MVPLAAAAGLVLFAALVWPFLPSHTTPSPTDPVGENELVTEMLAMSDSELDALLADEGALLHLFQHTQPLQGPKRFRHQ